MSCGSAARARIGSGEGIYDLFDEVIGETIRHFDAKGEIKREPIRFDLEKTFQAPSLHSYPGKIAADAKSNRLIVSDSNHNRILVSNLSGLILENLAELVMRSISIYLTTLKFKD